MRGTSEQGVFLSTDGGNSWIPTNLFNRAVFCFDSSGNKIFAGTSQGIYESTNFGFNWTQTTFNEEITSSMVINENLFFAGTFSGWVYVSDNNGITWNQWNEGLTQLTASALLILNNFIYNGTKNSVFRRPVGELSGTEMILNEVPERFSLSQNYPNPFNPTTSIEYRVMSTEYITLKVYDILGKEVAVLIDEEKPAGSYELTFDAFGLSSGTYFYKLQTGDFVQTKKMILLR